MAAMRKAESDSAHFDDGPALLLKRIVGLHDFQNVHRRVRDLEASLVDEFCAGMRAEKVGGEIRTDETRTVSDQKFHRSLLEALPLLYIPIVRNAGIIVRDAELIWLTVMVRLCGTIDDNRFCFANAFEPVIHNIRNLHQNRILFT